MPIIDEIQKMQQQGIAEQEITKNLGEQGYSPREISDALSQIKIKAAVADPGTAEGGVDVRGEEGISQPVTQEMQPSMLGAPVPGEMPAPGGSIPGMPEEMAAYPPAPAGLPAPEPIMPAPGAPGPAEMAAYPPAPGAAPEEMAAYPPAPEVAGMAPGEYYAPYQSMGMENVTEIVEHVSEEKIQEVKKQISELSKEKRFMDSRIVGIDDRLKRIEKTIQQLQIKILERVSDYGRGIDEIKKEMRSMGDSFGKVIDPLLGKTRGVVENREAETGEERETSRKPKKIRSKAKSEESDGFESYLRQ